MNQKFTCVNGMRIAYMEKNPSASETIFFIHGNSGASRSWQGQFESVLLENYRLIAFDLPGHGNSDWGNDPLQDYSPRETARQLSEAIRNVANGGPFILIRIALYHIYDYNVHSIVCAYLLSLFYDLG